MANKRKKTRNLIFHEFKLGHSAAKAARATTKMTCFCWYSKFRSGNKHRKDNKRLKRSIIDKKALRLTIEANTTKTTHELTLELGSLKSTIHKNLHKIRKSNKRGQEVLLELNERQKNLVVDCCKN